MNNENGFDDDEVVMASSSSSSYSNDSTNQSKHHNRSIIITGLIKSRIMDLIRYLKKSKLKDFLLFMLMGCGSYWGYPSALVQEIPYLELHQPEGLCIATFMNAATNTGFIFMFIYTALYEYGYQMPYHFCVPCLLIISPFGCFFTGLFYSTVVNNISLFLYIGCAIGGIVGALSSVIFNPFMTAYASDMISAARAGGSAIVLVTALVSITQGPGTTDNFTVSEYLYIFGGFLVLPIFAYYYISAYGLGLQGLRDNLCIGVSTTLHSNSSNRTHKLIGDDDECKEVEGKGIHDDQFSGSSLYSSDTSHGYALREDSHSNLETESSSSHVAVNKRQRRGASAAYNPLHSLHSTAADHGPPSSHDLLGYEAHDDLAGAAVATSSGRDMSSRSLPSSSSSSSSRSQLQFHDSPAHISSIDNYMSDVCASLVPNSWHLRRPWLRKTLPYIFAVSWTQFNTWGLMGAAIPFTIKNASVDQSNSGAGNLSVAYQLGAMALLVGDISTVYCRLPIRYTTLVFTLCVAIIYIGLLNLPIYHTSAAAPLLIFFFTLGRLMEAHMLTSCYRQVAAKFSEQDREHASRALGVADQFSTTAGAIISTFTVYSVASC